MKFAKNLVLIIFLLSCWPFHGYTFSQSDSSLVENINDSVKILSNKINELEEIVNSKNSVYQANNEVLKFATQQADNRIGWTISIFTATIGFIFVMGGWFTYFFTYKPAKEILDNFDAKVEQKFLLKEESDIVNNIKLAFDYMREDKYFLHENTKLILEQLPKPTKTKYREEILKRIIIENYNDKIFSKLMEILECIFFQENDEVNDDFALYLLNNKNVRGDIVTTYFEKNYKDSKKLIQKFSGHYTKSDTKIGLSSWLMHRKFDEFYKAIEDDKKTVEELKEFIIDGTKRGESPEEMRDAILSWAGGDSEKENTYFFLKRKKLLEIAVNEIMDN